MSKKITIKLNGPHLPLGGERRTFRSLRTARVWVKSHMHGKPFGQVSVSYQGIHGGRFFDRHTPGTRAWGREYRKTFGIK